MKFLLVALLAVGAFAFPQSNILAEGPSCPIDDPLIIEADSFNISIPPIFTLNEGSFHLGGRADGLTSLRYVYNYAILTGRLDFEAWLGGAEVFLTSYDATGSIDGTPFRPETIPRGAFVGSGRLEAAASGFHIKGTGVLGVNIITNMAQLRSLAVQEIDFNEVRLNLGTVTVGGQPWDMAAWNANFKQNFFQDWASVGPEFVEMVRISINEELSKYTLAQLLELLFPTNPSTCPPRF